MSEAGAPETSVDVDRCLDTIASMLRSWGRHAFDLDELRTSEIAKLFEGWARHALLATPPPGDEDLAPAAQSVRDWAALENFVREFRQKEQGHVIASLEDLRQVVWIFVQAFSKAVESDRNADSRIVQQLTKLRDAAHEASPAALKREATASANLIEGAIEVRKARYESQIEVLSTRLDRMASELIETQEKGSLDPLTGVYNRAALDDRMTRMSQLGAVLGSCAIAFMIDIDHFKWVNDKFGHAVGDDVLRRVARRVAQTLRRRNDFLGRYGGDEFVAVVEGRTIEDATAIGDRILFAVREVEVEHEGKTVRVSVSVGAARLLPGDDRKSWLARADRAMYSAKQSGRDGISVDSDAESS